GGEARDTGMEVEARLRADARLGIGADHHRQAKRLAEGDDFERFGEAGTAQLDADGPHRLERDEIGDRGQGFTGLVAEQRYGKRARHGGRAARIEEVARLLNESDMVLVHAAENGARL